MSIVKRTTYVDDETGEILQEKDSIIKDVTVKFKVGSGGGNVASRFSKVFHLEDPNFKIASHYQYFYKCLLQLEMSTNRIVRITAKSDMNEPLNEDDLSKLLNCNKKTVLRFLDFCIKNGIIARLDINKELFGFLINPIYAINGSRISSMLYSMFNKDGSLDKHIPTNELIKLKEYLKMKSTLDTGVRVS